MSFIYCFLVLTVCLLSVDSFEAKAAGDSCRREGETAILVDICSKYLECRGGRFVLRQCVEGSVFDDVREACVPSFLEKTECHRKCSFVERKPLRGSRSKYVYCEKGVVKIGFCENFFNTYTGKCEQLFIDVNSRDNQTKLSSLGLDSVCSFGSRRRNEDSCSEYLECDSTSTWARRQCSDNQHFDPTAMECVPAWMHFCDDQKYEITSIPTDLWSTTPLNERSTSETSSSDGFTSESSQSQWPTTESSPTEGPTSESSPSEGPTSESSPSEGPTSESSPSEGPTSESSPTAEPTSESSPTEGPITSPSVEPTNTPSSDTPRTDQPTDEPSSEMPSSTTVLTTMTVKPTTKTTKATTTKGPQCTEGEKKFIAGDCKHYLECKSGLWTIQTCFFGFDFDVDKLRCVLSWWAAC